MNILGISAYYHDSAACLVQDGRIRSAAQEERFTRIKHDESFPENAIAWCLKEAGLAHGDVQCAGSPPRPHLRRHASVARDRARAPRARPCGASAPAPAVETRAAHVPIVCAPHEIVRRAYELCVQRIRSQRQRIRSAKAAHTISAGSARCDAAAAHAAHPARADACGSGSGGSARTTASRAASTPAAAARRSTASALEEEIAS